MNSNWGGQHFDESWVIFIISWLACLLLKNQSKAVRGVGNHYLHSIFVQEVYHVGP